MPSIIDRRAHADDRGIADGRTGRIERIGDMSAGMKDVLKVRLNGPAGHDLRLVGEFQRGLVILDRSLNATEVNGVLLRQR